MIENIHFYFTNDLHSHFEHWSRVASYMKMKRLESKERNESSWVVDIGDHIDRSHPITEATMGKANVELMNALQYDFATLGNNEGITLSHTNLYHLYDDATFEVICSNLQCTTNENPRWLRQSKIVVSNNGIKVGVIGLTVPFNKYYHLLGWHIEDVKEVLEREINDLKDKTDVIVLLSHLGIHLDQQIAEDFSEIDVIIGGHTHHLIRRGEIVGNTLITAAGKHCAFVGEVTIKFDHQLKQVVHKTASVTEIEHFHRDLATEQRLGELTEMADVILAKKIISVDKPITVHWFNETEIMKRFTEKLRTWAYADIAMLNAGLLLDEFPAGEITYRHVHHICPHPINPSIVELTAKQLENVVKASFSRPFMELKLKGFGFRGEVIGRMIYANLDVQTEFIEGEEVVTSITFDGKRLDENVTYRVATADTFTFGRLLPEIAQAEVKELYLPEFLREILVQTLIDYKQNEE